MKKFFSTFIAVVALVAGNAAMAQGDLHVGYIQNTFSTTAHSALGAHLSSASNPGYYAGLSYNINLNHHFGLMLGVEGEYFNIKDTASVIGVAGVRTESMRVNVNVPIMLNYYLRFGREVKLMGFGGLSLNYGIINKTDFHGFAAGVTEDWTQDNYAQASWLDRYSWGLLYGARLSYGKVGVHAMWLYGISDLNSDETIETKCSRMMFGVDLQF